MLTAPGRVQELDRAPPPPDLPAPPARAGASGTGVLDHIAFEAIDLPGMRAVLAREGVAHTERVVPRSGITQIFIEDPNGLTLELNFAETAAG